ncbi:hypothetical protein F511_32018 [Dorcoceras hygrometricum]|uniref:Uncharacterized protein n=1 Tax=Dorcoceras hygrometricum TaxID=472368 RepID=A0A2Z7D3C8_9LAMI|nr:hypothetical protein F511_32018 [Dorcoceras hygrometricum]
MGKMGKQSKSKKPEAVGKGKVTPVQIAFIVDRYLCDNSYSQTRSSFRSEASHLISKSPVHEAPKSLLSLAAILDEYITLKEHKVWVEQERCRLEQEKFRVQNLLKGMQDVMNAYNSSGVTSPPLPLPPAVASRAVVSQAEVAVVTSSGCHPMYNSPAMMSTSGPSNGQLDPTNFSTPLINHVNAKRQGPKDVSNASTNVKRSRKCTEPKGEESRNVELNQDNSVINPMLHVIDNTHSGSPIQGSNVVKCLFNEQVQSPPVNSTVPKTPPRASSQTDKLVSSSDICSASTSTEASTQRIISNNCTIISSETIRVTPTKQIGYYSIEKNHCITTCSPVNANVKNFTVKDHVKGKLDFGVPELPMIPEHQTPEGTSTSESDMDANFLDLDFSNLEAFGLDFNFSEFLAGCDIEGEGLGLSSQQVTDSSPDSHTGSTYTPENANMDAQQMTSHKEVNLVSGSDSVAALHSVTKCITIMSPGNFRSRKIS